MLRLVERFLRPVDPAVARSTLVPLRKGRSAGCEQHRNLGAACIDNPADCVSRAGDGVDHDGLRPSGNHRVTVGHRDGSDFMRDGDRLGQRLFGFHLASVGLDDRAKSLSTAVSKQILDAAGGK